MAEDLKDYELGPILAELERLTKALDRIAPAVADIRRALPASTRKARDFDVPDALPSELSLGYDPRAPAPRGMGAVTAAVWRSVRRVDAACEDIEAIRARVRQPSALPRGPGRT